MEGMAVAKKKPVVKKKKAKIMTKFSKTFLKEEMEKRLIEQSNAINVIIPYITTYMAELSAGTRPIAAFLLLGPTGVGKTATVENLAQVLHGDIKKVLRIDCAQFELSHEIAKLVGAPPGYLGHRETGSMLSQKNLQNVTSEKCDISIILFDEIEKAHPN